MYTMHMQRGHNQIKHITLLKNVSFVQIPLGHFK